MERFYKLLRGYNEEHTAVTLPEWTGIYCEAEPPVYWTLLGDLLGRLPRGLSVLEIGAGAGDVMALLMYLGFKDVRGVERDVVLAEAANRKLAHFFGCSNRVLAGSYPLRLERPSDLLVQMNCVYPDGLSSRSAYLSRVRDWMYHNGTPRAYAVEVLDREFLSPKFPAFVHLTEQEVRSAFPECSVTSYLTYRYPRNSSTKRLYLIEPLEGK